MEKVITLSCSGRALGEPANEEGVMPIPSWYHISKQVSRAVSDLIKEINVAIFKNTWYFSLNLFRATGERAHGKRPQAEAETR